VPAGCRSGSRRERRRSPRSRASPARAAGRSIWSARPSSRRETAGVIGVPACCPAPTVSMTSHALRPRIVSRSAAPCWSPWTAPHGGRARFRGASRRSGRSPASRHRAAGRQRRLGCTMRARARSLAARTGVEPGRANRHRQAREGSRDLRPSPVRQPFAVGQPSSRASSSAAGRRRECDRRRRRRGSNPRGDSPLGIATRNPNGCIFAATTAPARRAVSRACRGRRERPRLPKRADIIGHAWGVSVNQEDPVETQGRMPGLLRLVTPYVQRSPRVGRPPVAAVGWDYGPASFPSSPVFGA
jgi:hypothetical protein